MPKLKRDDVGLYFEDTGPGAAPPMMFVHGWGCDHTIFGPQRAYFSRSRRTIAVDLRGHGLSDAPRQDYTVDGFVDDLAALCKKLNLPGSIVVGHSMGGTIALEFAAQHPEHVAATVAIDSVLFPSPALIDNLRPLCDALLTPDYLVALATALPTLLFAPTDDMSIRSQIGQIMNRTPQHVLASTLVEHIVRYDATSAAAACGTPVAYIASENALADLHRFRELCPQLKVGQTLGVGHFSTLLAPAQINAMLETFCPCRLV
jgi:pimeloyl-ACP methyl ester carboxylesterase